MRALRGAGDAVIARYGGAAAPSIAAANQDRTSALIKPIATKLQSKRGSGRSIARTLRIMGLCIGLFLSAGGTGLAAASPSPPAAPQGNIQSFYDTLLATMKQGPALGRSGRYKRLAPVLDRRFDLPFMAQLAVGPSWGSMTAAQQKEITDAFGRYLAAVYADRFDSYSGEKFEVQGERPYGANVIVDTRIVKSDGEPVAINYLMRNDKGAWRVADIYLDGTISQMATQRAEFHSILSRKGIEGLIGALNQKADRLLAGNSSAPS